ncbi:MAG TPA: DUF3738 domain-containing protein [Vicinamibacterales bacterium]
MLPPKKPDVDPSDHAYITPTKRPPGDSYGATVDDFWVLEGRRVREVLAEVCELPESRVGHAATVDDSLRFDFVLVPPDKRTPRDMQRLLRESIARHFRLELIRDVREEDVYSMTAPDGVSVPVQPPGGGLFSWSFDFTEDAGADNDDEARARFVERVNTMTGRTPANVLEARTMSMGGTSSLADLCQMLEGVLGRPVVDETGIEGSIEFKIRDSQGTDGLLEDLRERYGLAVTPVRRKIERLVLRPLSGV